MAGRSVLIKLEPLVLRWARERRGVSQEQLAQKMHVKPAAVSLWENSGEITAARVIKLSNCTHTPLGHLYLDEPFEDSLPIPDFRTRNPNQFIRPSPDLLDTVYSMQRRQFWMREERIDSGADPLDLVGFCNRDSYPIGIAESMRKALSLQEAWASHESSWNDALRSLRNHAEEAGVLVVFNGVVGNNTHRKLNPDEFLGFALVDEYAPVVFVNGADYKAAQMFTLAHELAHIFIGATGVTRHRNLHPTDNDAEQLCDRAAAEFLVPESQIEDFRTLAYHRSVDDLCQSIANRFKVSRLVAARRALDEDLIDQAQFFAFYNSYKIQVNIDEQQRRSGGGDFWNNQGWRLGKEFGAAIVRAVKEGRLSYRDAYRLTGLTGESFAQMPTEMNFKL